jgi:PAS domain S-box-containing protein
VQADPVIPLEPGLPLQHNGHLPHLVAIRGILMTSTAHETCGSPPPRIIQRFACGLLALAAISPLLALTDSAFNRAGSANSSPQAQNSPRIDHPMSVDAAIGILLLALALWSTSLDLSRVAPGSAGEGDPTGVMRPATGLARTESPYADSPKVGWGAHAKSSSHQERYRPGRRWSDRLRAGFELAGLVSPLLVLGLVGLALAGEWLAAPLTSSALVAQWLGYAPPTARLAPISIINLFALASALWLARRNPTQHLSQLLASAVAIFTLIGLISASFGVSQIYHVGLYHPSGIHTTLPLLLLAIALLLIVPSGPLAPIIIGTSPSARLVRRFLAIVLIVPWLTGWLAIRISIHAAEVDQLIAMFTTLSIAALMITLIPLAVSMLQVESNATQLLQSIGDAVIATDRSGNITLMNRAAERLTGWSNSQANGQNLTTVCVIDDALAAAGNSSQLAKLPGYSSCIARDGSTHIVTTNQAAIRDVHGGSLGSIIAIRDVSRECQAHHDALRMQAQLDCAPITIALLDSQGRITQVNAAWRRFAEANLADPQTTHGVGCDYLAACRAAGDPLGHKIAHQLEQILSGQLDSWSATYACHAPTLLRWFRLSAHRAQDIDDVCVVLHLDITDQVLAERRLAVQTAVADWLTEDLAIDTLCERLTATAGEELEWDAAVAWWVPSSPTAAPLAQWVRSSCPKLPTAARILDSHLQRALQEHQRPRWLSSMADGGLTPAQRDANFQSGVGFTLTTHRDRQCLIVCLGRNQRPFEGATIRLLADVARQVTVACERRALLTQMMQMDRKALLGTLAAGLGHEINTPLAALLTNLELAREAVRERAQQTPGLAELASSLEESTLAGNRLLAIVRDLRMFARQDDSPPAPTDVATVLRSTIRLAWNVIRHRAQLVERIDDDVPPVLATASHLGQVFLNLILNAVQAIPPGQVATQQLRVALAFNDGRVVVTVSDSGCGMSNTTRERLFEPFFTTKPVGEGTGLGLPLCQRIVTELGGEIVVASTLGQGATFTVRLPPAQQEIAEQRCHTNSATSASPAATVGAAATAGTDDPSTALSPTKPTAPEPLVPQPTPRGAVLIIDDDEPLRRMMLRLLGSEHDCTAVSRANDALARLQAGDRFDVILCDVMMPEVGGHELYEQVVREYPDQAQRMVFLSGGAFTATTQAFLAQLAQRVIDKPFDHRKLKARVAKLVAEAQANR